MERRGQDPLLTPFDVLGLAAAAFGALLAVTAVLRIQPEYRKMFADFGFGSAALPFVTELCLSPAFAVVFAAVGPLLVVGGIVSRAEAQLRAAFALGAIIAPAMGVGLFVYGMRVPAQIFSGLIK